MPVAITATELLILTSHIIMLSPFFYVLVASLLVEISAAPGSQMLLHCTLVARRLTCTCLTVARVLCFCCSAARHAHSLSLTDLLLHRPHQLPLKLFPDDKTQWSTPPTPRTTQPGSFIISSTTVTSGITTGATPGVTAAGGGGGGSGRGGSSSSKGKRRGHASAPNFWKALMPATGAVAGAAAAVGGGGEGGTSKVNKQEQDSESSAPEGAEEAGEGAEAGGVDGSEKEGAVAAEEVAAVVAKNDIQGRYSRPPSLMQLAGRDGGQAPADTTVADR